MNNQNRELVNKDESTAKKQKVIMLEWNVVTEEIADSENVNTPAVLETLDMQSEDESEHMKNMELSQMNAAGKKKKKKKI